MKKYILSIIIVVSIISCQQQSPSKNAEKPTDAIVIGQIDSLYSDILDESRKLWIHIPESAKNESSTTAKYPVLYLLDAPRHFYSVAGMIKQLSTANGNTVVPEMIIVAIENTDRSRDLTPTRVDIDHLTGDSLSYSSGGGNRFLDFIADELMPYVEDTYPVSPYRTFVGHSFGGLSVINALANRPQLFNNYVAIDPSLWWDDRAFLNTSDSLMTKSELDGKALYLGVANTMLSGMDTTSVQSDTIAQTMFTAHISSILKFAQSTENMDNGLNFQWKYYENDDHGSVPLIAEYDALRFLFSWYQLKGVNDFFAPDSKAPAEDLIEMIRSHYKNISENFGYEVRPPQEFINGLGQAFMYEKKYDTSYALLNWNIETYPDNAEAYSAMGDYYMAQSDTTNAIKNFKKTLEIDKNHAAKEKLMELDVKK